MHSQLHHKHLQSPIADCGGGGGTPGGPASGWVSTMPGGGAGGAIGGGEDDVFGLAIVGGGLCVLLNCLTGGEATLLGLGEPKGIRN